MSYIAKLDKKTSSNLEAIYKYSYDKWFMNKLPTRNKPSKLDIVRTLINGLYKSMIEEGEIKE